MRLFPRIAKCGEHPKLGPIHHQKVGIHIHVSALFASEQEYEFGCSSTRASVLIVSDHLLLVCKKLYVSFVPEYLKS